MLIGNSLNRTIDSGSCRTPMQTANFVLGNLMVNKTNYSPMVTLILGILAGAYIGFGCEISTLAAHDAASFLGFGIARLLAGTTFSLGLVLVVISGGELFTGNILMAGSVLDRKITPATLGKNWLILYLANFIGALLLASLVFYTQSWQQNNMLLGTSALKLAITKVNLSFGAAFTRGILCNWLVCLAIWISAAAKHIIGKIFAILFPIATFVALGYEHSVANMFFIPKAMLLATQSQLVSLANVPGEQLAKLTLSGLLGNLLPVTLGNIVGASLFVAIPHWLAFVKKSNGKNLS